MSPHATNVSLPFATVSEDALVGCVSCGLCLPHCPTYRVTGLDAYSPRGRISIVNSVRKGDLALDATAIEALDSCVQCMGCLPACPSGVRYDEIIAPVVVEIARRRAWRMRFKRLLLSPLGRPLILRSFTWVGAVTQRARLMPARLSLPRLPIRQPEIVRSPMPTTSDRPRVKLFVGCVMDAWYRPVHVATVQVLNALGFSVEPTDSAICCGALHRHAGDATQASSFEAACRANLHDDIVVFNSAGCGAQLSHHIKGAIDVMTLVSRSLERLGEVTEASNETVAIHDACHSRNILRTHNDAHIVLGALYKVAALPDDGLCCGAGGAYSFDHPEMAAKILERKYSAIESLGEVTRLASGNPGCSAHIEAHIPTALRGLSVVHPIELVAERLKKESTA